MSSSLAFKTGLTALGGVGVVGGGVVLGKKVFSSPVSKENPTKEPISKVLEKSLMSFADENLSAQWEVRKTKLDSAKNEDLVSSLRSIKDKSGYTSDDVKDWCRENVGGFADDEGGKRFRNVSDYCTFNIKDKLTNIISDGNWSSANQKLKNTKDNLSTEMTSIKEELNKTRDVNENALKDWCDRAYKKMFVGEQDQFFKDAAAYCVVG